MIDQLNRCKLAVKLNILLLGSEAPGKKNEKHKYREVGGPQYFNTVTFDINNNIEYEVYLFLYLCESCRKHLDREIV